MPVNTDLNIGKKNLREKFFGLQSISETGLALRARH